MGAPVCGGKKKGEGMPPVPGGGHMLPALVPAALLSPLTLMRGEGLPQAVGLEPTSHRIYGSGQFISQNTLPLSLPPSLLRETPLTTIGG